MELRRLKTVRVVVSLLFFVPAVLTFLDLTGVVPRVLVNVVADAQVAPALLKLFSGASLSLIGLIVVTLLTLAFGRVYCSTICPLGTLQDLFSRLNRKRNSRRRFVFRHQNYLLHYGLLTLTVLLAGGGSILLLNLLEPFSNFGRLTVALIRPLAVLLNDTAAWGLGSMHIYTLYDIPLRMPSPAVIAVPLLFAATVFLLSYRHGRLFCNTLCPAGALLGLLSRLALFRIVVDKRTCKSCGLCEKVCKTGCIDSENLRVDFSACVSCFNCLEVCPTVGLKYEGVGAHRGVSEDQPANRARRKFIGRGGRAAAAFLVVPADTLRIKLPAPSGKTRSKLPVTPPGSLGIEHFTSRCTACHLCVSVCPTQVLVPTFLEYGLDGLFQPRMDYFVSTCNYDCTACGEVCPSGAILPLPPEQKKLVQMGKAKFIKDDCIVVTKKTECGACSEHCPTKAVHMVKYEGLFLPEVTEDLCIGCGSCEHPCPTTPNKAIYVEANPVHLTAKKPETKKAEPEVKQPEEFPF